MTDNYDTETMRAIVAEAKCQGFDDKIIALNLGIARDDPAFGYEGDDQLRASISELDRRGIHFEGIAERLSLSLEETVRLHGNPDVRVGLWGVYVVGPYNRHHPDEIRRLIDRGRKTLNKGNHGGTIALLRKPSPNESLALLVDSLGFEGARNLIAAFLQSIGNVGDVAVGLHIPEVAARAVLFGSFPATEPAPTLQ